MPCDSKHPKMVKKMSVKYGVKKDMPYHVSDEITRRMFKKKK